ncbi:uncharacterized protein LY89DRAFT_788535 [Mollisia scopiformis]|uniref:Uncharacterized protein n=1 Tax=Mollisia scopiformis TaxID=149040 RepID=A0A132B9T6_MOLSC|nr:uncharacterized protein LY89DRAFT_788535 [Mollisia scopiformis]KUJ09141.1 hypothetical protein LY89DRAFT_788535 [Mollisia scopiformis]
MDSPQLEHPPNSETLGGNDITQPTFRRGISLAAVPGTTKGNLGFEYAEHSYLRDTTSLTLANGSIVTALHHPFTLTNGLRVSYGQINGLAGNFYGTFNPIGNGKSAEEQRDRFIAAFKTLDGPKDRQPKEARDILKNLDAEVAAINNALATYTSRPVRFPGYLLLARINWDHFGSDARIAYNAGHQEAINVALGGNLELAYSINAFADHYLEDSFSAGHLRTPRRFLHSFGGSDDLCSKYMHDEDNAIGLSVKNPAGEAWIAYGDKRGMDRQNNDNKKHYVKALQVSANEIYSAWKNKTKLSPPMYGAWAHAPTLESARAPQILAPLFRDSERRKNMERHRDFSYESFGYFSAFTMGPQLALSRWWSYPLTLDGPPGILNGSHVATTAIGPGICNVYYQTAQGHILEDHFDETWKFVDGSSFKPKLWSPLAAI